MASSRDSSNKPDWRDLADILTSFQVENKVTVSITVEPTVTGTTNDLRLTLDWSEVGEQRPVQVRSDCLSVTCLATNRTGLEAAILALLYQLDFRLALNEFRGIRIKR